MTIELIVDRMQWIDAAQNPVTTCCNASVQFPIVEDRARLRFDAALMELRQVIDGFGDRVRIVKTVEDIDAAKADGVLGIILGTEGSLATDGDVANLEDLYARGWRKVQLRRGDATPFADQVTITTPVGERLVAALNQRGITIDTMHLYTGEIDKIVTLTNAPLLDSHEWPRGIPALSTTERLLKAIVETGGGHGVIALNALGSAYDQVYNTPAECPSSVVAPNQPATVSNFVDRLECMRLLVGIDHVAIGPDYMPEPNNFAIGGHGQGAIPSLGRLPDLTLELVNRGYTDDDILKLLGGNLRDLYQRVWDPTHGYDGGPAHFRLCSNTSTEPSCVAARSNSGQGDLRHRAINCQHPSDHQPVGLQLTYTGGQWQFWDLANHLVPCARDSTLVVSWGDGEPANGRLGIYGDSTCDAACQQAITAAGAGTTTARALSCGSPGSSGIVGLQLAYMADAWQFYSIAGQLERCTAGSTFVASWDSGKTPNANVRLCDDRNGHPACAAAALNGGNGTAQAKALNCFNSTPDAAAHGLVALQLTYHDGRWWYYDLAGVPRLCVHGSVLVATTL